MTGTPEATKTGPGEPGKSGPDLVTVAAAVVTGIGTLGWVTFVGGAILWISFQQAGLPEAEAVAKVPPSVLIATGAEFVVFALLAAVAVIGLLYWGEDRVLRFETKERLAKLSRLRSELRASQDRHAAAARRVQTLQQEFEKLNTALEGSRDFLADREGQPAGERHDDQVEDARRRVEELTSNCTQAEKQLEAAKESLTQAGEAEQQAHQALDAAPAPTRLESLRGGLLPALLLTGASILAAIFVDLGYGALPSDGYLPVLLAALFAGVVGAVLYRNTASFGVMGLVALIAVPLVIGVGTYFRAQDTPQVEPVALLKTDGTPFVGFFLAETSDRVFVGTFEELAPDPCANVRRRVCEQEVEIKVPARLLSLPSSDVRNLTVGPSRPLEANDALATTTGRPRTAREWAGGAALLLCEEADIARRKAAGQSPTEAAQSPAEAAQETPLPTTCSKEDVEKLREFLETERAFIESS